MKTPVGRFGSAKIPRRHFIRTTAMAMGGVGMASIPVTAAQPSQKLWRAAVIGRTGGGDYGHGYDQVFKGLDNVTVEAVADPDPAGLARAAQRTEAKRRYADYREMLEREKPELVCIAPRFPDCHPAMALAAIQVAKGIFIEKPFTETPAEADAVLAAAGQRGVKIQVAHNRRYTSEFVQAKALLDQGLIGQVRQVHIYGKQDKRVGGEDMIVLGTHDFDLMRFYFGDPRWCLASVTQDGHDLTRADVRQGAEPILVAGDTVHALFAFPHDIMVHWSSVKRSDHWNTNAFPREKWALEILGTKGILAQQSDFAWLDSPFLEHKNDGVQWRDLPRPSHWEWPDHARYPIKSLIHAIETNQQPVCSGEDGRWTVEMVASVYESQRTGARVRFPLAQRDNPLRRF